MRPMYQPLSFTSYKVSSLSDDQSTCIINVKKGRVKTGSIHVAKTNSGMKILSESLSKPNRIINATDRKEALTLASKVFVK